MRLLLLVMLAFISATTAQAAAEPPRLSVPVPGSPGTATPTPYPQITPATSVRAGDARPGAPLLLPMPVPGPPKDQPLPGLRPDPVQPSPTGLGAPNWTDPAP